jgi:hypothetical protein
MKGKLKSLGEWTWDAFVLCLTIIGYALVIGVKSVWVHEPEQGIQGDDLSKEA